eukprot:TRINITY_DN26329_c0_g1_i1.p1 TRINITY_DN26329_c0_g1~~TRINITY_DN26329_c0_g1_i1.p1  ORF type:complete len:604 (-),score=138.07 TRINITY_DN26329_c0_g1_i1:114-1925(-)
MFRLCLGICVFGFVEASVFYVSYIRMRLRRLFFFFFFFKQKTAYEMLRSLVGSEMCIRDRYTRIFFSTHYTEPKHTMLYVQCPYPISFHEAFIAQWLSMVGLSIPLPWNHTLPVPLYAGLVIQETRHMENSTGAFDFFDLSREDAGDTIAWIVSQPWSNGEVIPFGVSAMGMKSILTSGATLPTGGGYNPPSQQIGLWPNGMYSAAYRSGAYNWGITNMMLTWTNETNETRKVVTHETPTWWTPSAFTEYSKVRWPTVMWAGWFDIFQKTSMEGWEAYRTQSHWTVRDLHKLVVDPLGHCGLHGGITPFLNASAIALITKTNALYTFLLFKSTESGSNLERLAKWAAVSAVLPRMVWMVLGSEGGWVTARSDWPDATLTRYFLAQNSTLSATPPASSSESYRYDPADPAPTLGGFQFYNPKDMTNTSCGPVDTTPLVSRQDVVTFDGPVLAEPLALTGKVNATLTVSSSCNDTDFVVRLVDVFPPEPNGSPGVRMLMTDGVIRMRWRHLSAGSDIPELLRPNQTYQVNLDLLTVSYVLAAGHRLGFEITSSSFPAYAPNPNTGVPLNHAGPNVTAVNAVHLGPSFISLPVVDISQLPHWKLPI